MSIPAPETVLLETLLARYGGNAVSFGIGLALGTVSEPYTRSALNDLWETNPSKPVPFDLAARIVAQGLRNADWGRTEAIHAGIQNPSFDSILEETHTAPDLGTLLRLIRRATIEDPDFEHGLHKHMVEDQWFTALRDLANEKLSPEEIAKAIHRNIMAGEGLILVEPSSAPGKVDVIPQSPIDPRKEAAAWGIDPERLRVLVANTGLPPGIIESLQLLNRGAITEDDFSRVVAESNMRNEYTQVLLALRRRLLTPHNYAELQLRGWISQSERDSGAALSGMEAADAQLLFEMLGRPLGIHAITTGHARGGEFKPSPGSFTDPYEAYVHWSNLRPEFYDLAIANKYSYPSAFVIRTLAQTGELSPQEVNDTLLKIGWEPGFAALVTKAWTGGATTKADPHVTKAETQLWNAVHKAYVDDSLTDAEADTLLADAGVVDTARPDVLKLWKAERGIIRKTLTAKQITNAIGQPGHDRAWAVETLTDQGYSADDIEAILGPPPHA